MRITLLGTGTSTGVPMIGCECPVCTSDDPRDRRMRTSALIETPNGNILIDAGPDMRTQLLSAQVRSLHGVLLTHEHQDHIGGLDDLRPLNYRMQAAISLYGLERTLNAILHRFHYAFGNDSGGSSRPNLNLVTIEPFKAIHVAGLHIIPLPVQHGPMSIVGYRIGDFGYITDASTLGEATCEALYGVKTLVINALRHDPHPMHLSFDQALDYVNQIAPQRAFFVHLSHDITHAALAPTLPAHVRPGYDGLQFEVDA
jgi:phosphoribosyl 1,2-cyclic phosphate phosphodiesterase